MKCLTATTELSPNALFYGVSPSVLKSALRRRLGRSIEAVSMRRVRLRISLVKPIVKSWDDEEVRLFGKLKDKEVSELTGRSRMGVAIMRRKLRIPVIRAIAEQSESSQGNLMNGLF